jgi:hypothetical protein
MKLARRSRLFFEQLEDRSCPSLTVSLIAGSLTISGTPLGNLEIQETAPKAFHVLDNFNFGLGTGFNLGTYVVTGNMTLNLVNHANGDVEIDFIPVAGGPSLGGNLMVNLGFGDTSGTHAVRIQGTGAGGSIGGSLSILKGSGQESIFLGNDFVGATPLRLTVGGDANVNLSLSAASSLSFLGPGDTLILNSAVTVGGTLNTSNVDNLFLAAPLPGDNGATVGKSMSANNYSERIPISVFINGTVRQDVTVVGPNAPGTSFIGEFTLGDGLGNGTIFGNLNVNMYNAPKNMITLSTGSNVLGSAFLNAGAGSTTVTLQGSAGLLSGAAIGSSANIGLGDGNNTVVLNAGASIAGNLNLTLGNGNDSTLVDATVSGTMTLQLGNGTDSTTIGNASAGLLSYTSGNGNDSLTLGDGTTAAGETWNVNLRFGTGSDTLALSAAAPATQFLTGFVDMGGPPLGNSFDPTGQLGVNWSIVQPWTLQNV